jgi:hypothetical protein
MRKEAHNVVSLPCKIGVIDIYKSDVIGARFETDGTKLLGVKR